MSAKPPFSPRQVRRTQTRAAILEAAQQQIRSRGVEGLSLRGVARAVSYSPAALYEYFASKEELVAAVARGVDQRLTEALSAVPLDQPPHQRLVELGLAYIAFALQAPEDFHLLFTQLGSRRRSLQEPSAEGSAYAVLLHAAGQAFAACGDPGALSPPPTRRRLDEVAYGLWSLVHGMATLQLTHLAGFDANFAAVDRRTLDEFVHNLLRGTALSEKV